MASIYEDIEVLPKEKWLPIKGFEDIYAISDRGRLASSKRGKWNLLSIKNSNGDYLSTVLRDGFTKKYSRIHRLVYETFVKEIPQGRKWQIHHKNGDKQDNRVENLKLERVDEHRRIHHFLNPNSIKGMVNYNKFIKPKKIEQYDLDGNYIATYNSATDASLITGVCSRNISQVANKEPYNDKGSVRKQAGGYIWKIKD